MALIHTPAHTTEHPDSFVDKETGREYTVAQDYDAEDPRNCFDPAYAALWAYRQPSLGWSSVADFPEGNWILDAFKRFYDSAFTGYSRRDVEVEAFEATRRWLRVFHPDDVDNYAIAIGTIRGHSQGDWLDVVAVTADGCGTPQMLMDEVRMWAWGDVWAVTPDDGETMFGIYADSAEEALKLYLEDHALEPSPPAVARTPVTRRLELTIEAETEEELDVKHRWIVSSFADSDALPEGVSIGDPTLYAFASDDEPDRYRDLWTENMPSVSGRMYFSIPGEQPIDIDDDMARRILVELSTKERGLA